MNIWNRRLHPNNIQEALTGMRAHIEATVNGQFWNLANYVRDFCTIDTLSNMASFHSIKQWAMAEVPLDNVKARLGDIPGMNKELTILLQGYDTSFDGMCTRIAARVAPARAQQVQDTSMFQIRAISAP